MHLVIINTIANRKVEISTDVLIETLKILENASNVENYIVVGPHGFMKCLDDQKINFVKWKYIINN